MNASARKGNNPEMWDKLLAELDDKLQLGLLDRLRRISAYHFENDTLYLETANAEDEQYLKKAAVATQLLLFAQEVTNVKDVKIGKPPGG